LYVQQGLMDEARAVYEQLLAARPGDQHLRERLAALRAPARPPTPARSGRYAAAETGGPSARTFLQSILDGAAVELRQPSGEEEEPSEPAMEQAFAAEPLEPRGQPTRPASSSYTLGQVFGEEVPPKPAPPPPREEQGGTGFSFDEFFAGGQKQAPRPSRGGSADEGDDDSFREWLKGLKK